MQLFLHCGISWTQLDFVTKHQFVWSHFWAQITASGPDGWTTGVFVCSVQFEFSSWMEVKIREWECRRKKSGNMQNKELVKIWKFFFNGFSWNELCIDGDAARLCFSDLCGSFSGLLVSVLLYTSHRVCMNWTFWTTERKGSEQLLCGDCGEIGIYIQVNPAESEQKNPQVFDLSEFRAKNAE